MIDSAETLLVSLDQTSRCMEEDREHERMVGVWRGEFEIWLRRRDTVPIDELVGKVKHYADSVEARLDKALCASEKLLDDANSRSLACIKRDIDSAFMLTANPPFMWGKKVHDAMQDRTPARPGMAP